MRCFRLSELLTIKEAAQFESRNVARIHRTGTTRAALCAMSAVQLKNLLHLARPYLISGLFTASEWSLVPDDLVEFMCEEASVFCMSRGLVSFMELVQRDLSKIEVEVLFKESIIDLQQQEIQENFSLASKRRADLIFCHPRQTGAKEVL